ncbi:hypothetical protein [Oceanobacillus jeddahense]|uniref:hypothetical protein n=1 Tax=Oceanobacillus jeddahense TaxID=1462527 RepID=UPI0005960561|nr:hypothetical protein [Oceanobacillus jeddahense]
MTLGAFIVGIILITIHLLTNQILPSDRIKRDRWLSLSGGIAAAYIFVYVLPAFHEEQASLEDTDGLAMESELYFVGLIGMLLFFGIQNLVNRSLNRSENKSDEAETKVIERRVFWVQIFFFSIYNMLISFVVIQSQVQGVQVAFYSSAIGLHFFAVAHDMWRENSEMYNKYGRYVLAAGIVVGWLVGSFVTFDTLILAIIFSFISGAMILNVIKYEMPAEREAHFKWFLTGAIGYSLIVLMLKFFFDW